MVAASAASFRHSDVAPLVEVGGRYVFELFWGPTLSFKDHALQNLGRLLDREVVEKSTIVGATSGDTGSAAIEACRGRGKLNIVILFPDGMVTEFQRRQMTTVPTTKPKRLGPHQRCSLERSAGVCGDGGDRVSYS